ncbi:MAG: DUF1761 domain-containing protein [Acidimicrobiia bacterium]
MNLDSLGDLNWLAVVVGALIYFALGALWYSPVLWGKLWQRAIGWDPERKPPEMRATSYLIPLAAFLVMAVTVGLIAAATGTDTFGEGLTLGLVLGIGLALMHTAVDANFDPNMPKPWVWFWINGSYHGIGALVLSVLVAVWR